MNVPYEEAYLHVKMSLIDGYLFFIYFLLYLIVLKQSDCDSRSYNVKELDPEDRGKSLCTALIQQFISKDKLCHRLNFQKLNV